MSAQRGRPGSGWFAALTSRKQFALCAAVLAAVNLIVIAPLFRVEILSYTGSIENTFIAIPRLMLKHWGDFGWWPFWNGGIPFENSYLPFTHWLTACLMALTGLSAGRAFHILCAAEYAASAVAAFWMAFELSRKILPSFIGALLYSSVSATAVAIPEVARDAGGLLNSRRLEDLLLYGEAPHMAALVFVTLAVVFVYRALTRPQVRWKLLAGAAASAVALSNAFGAVALLLAILCLLLAFPQRPWWRPLPILAAIGLISYCWISPWLSPNMLRAIRKCGPSSGVSSGAPVIYTPALTAAAVVMLCGFVALWLFMHRRDVAPPIRFFTLFAYFPVWMVVAWFGARASIVPQPWRFDQELDLAVPFVVVFAGAALVHRIPRRIAAIAGSAVLAALVIHAGYYAWGMVRPANPTSMHEYRIIQWLNRNRPGDRSYHTGSTVFLYNVWSDNPQIFGGHEQHTINTFLPIVRYTISSDQNAGDRAADYSVFWLKAFGVHQIVVPGPDSTSYWKPYVHPRKFEGVLPLVWRQDDDSIYEIPGRHTLAHVIPASAVVSREPIHGLDIAPAEAYVAALDDPNLPAATFLWHGISAATIHASLQPGQVLSVQETYDPGWEVWCHGRPERIRGDAIGQIVIDSDCSGQCDFDLRYTGRGERTATRMLSAAAMLLVLGYCLRVRLAVRR